MQAAGSLAHLTPPFVSSFQTRNSDLCAPFSLLLKMHVSRQGSVAISNPSSSETISGKPAAYSLNALSGIGISIAVVLGLLLLIGLWCWFWLRRPLPDSPDERAAEEARYKFLTASPEQRDLLKAGKRRASLILERAAEAAGAVRTAITTPLSPTKNKRFPRKIRTSSDGSRHRLTKRSPTPDACLPATAPLDGRFSMDDEFTPPRRTRSTPSDMNHPFVTSAGTDRFRATAFNTTPAAAPEILLNGITFPKASATVSQLGAGLFPGSVVNEAPMFVNFPAGRLQRFPHTDGTFSSNKVLGKRVRQPQYAPRPNAEAPPLNVSPTRATLGGSERGGTNLIRKPAVPHTRDLV